MSRENEERQTGVLGAGDNDSRNGVFIKFPGKSRSACVRLRREKCDAARPFIFECFILSAGGVFYLVSSGVLL